MHQAESFTKHLPDAGVPLEHGYDGAYMRSNAFLPHASSATAQAPFGRSILVV
jgi:hypothetical protein